MMKKKNISRSDCNKLKPRDDNDEGFAILRFIRNEENCFTEHDI